MACSGTSCTATIGVPSGHFFGASPLAWAAPTEHAAQTSDQTLILRLQGSQGLPALWWRTPQARRVSRAPVGGQWNASMGPDGRSSRRRTDLFTGLVLAD